MANDDVMFLIFFVNFPFLVSWNYFEFLLKKVLNIPLSTLHCGLQIIVTCSDLLVIKSRVRFLSSAQVARYVKFQMMKLCVGLHASKFCYL